MTQVQRFDIPSKGKATPWELFKAFREYVRKVSESQGETLESGWYPEKFPEEWADQPELLKAYGLAPRPGTSDQAENHHG